MPPAFNLSQDQTLQLKTSKLPALLPAAGATGGRANFSLKVNGVTSYYLLRALDTIALASSAHTYRLRIFKERWLRGEDLNL
jgi:hypothetical protein